MIPVKQVATSVLASILRRQPLSPDKVAFAWQTAAGGPLARATSARLAPDGVLEVAATSPHWAREIERSRDLLLDRVRVLLGDDAVTRIAVREAGDIARSSVP